MPASDRRPRAAQLLGRVLGDGVMSEDYLSSELRVSKALLAAYVAGERMMPLARQLYFAVLVRQKAPSLGREAAALQGQATAAIAMHTRETECHGEPPVVHRYWE